MVDVKTIRGQRKVEWALLAAIATAAVLIGLGLSFKALPALAPYNLDLFAGGLAVIITVPALVMSFDVSVLRHFFAADGGGTRYERQRRWTRLTASILLLTVLILFAALVLVGAALRRAGLVEGPHDVAGLDGTVRVLTLALGATIMFTHYQALRVPIERDLTDLRRAYVYVASLIGISFAVMGMLTVLKDGGVGPFRATDAPFFILMGMGSIGIGLFLTRSLPTPYAIFGDNVAVNASYLHYSRTKSLLFPTMIALGLVLALVLVFVVFGVGASTILERAVESSVTLIVLGFLGLAVAGSVAAAFMLAKEADLPALYKQKRTARERMEMWILGVSIFVAVCGLVGTYFLAKAPIMGIPSYRWPDMLAASLAVGLGPYGFYHAHQAARTRRMEERFPDLLRDLASSHKGGLTLPAAMAIAAKGDYGDLTPDVQKTADQLSWDVPFDQALSYFAERVRTPLVKRTVALILEASHSGAGTPEVLFAASRDAREIKTLESERRLTMSLYTAVIYVTFMVFLGVVGILYAKFVPEIVNAAARAAEHAASGVSGISMKAPSLAQFREFYFIAGLSQGVGNGIVAGMMGTGRAVLGLRHACIMVLITWAAFGLLF